jgi:hypothetical protein
MPRRIARQITPELAEKCRSLVYAAAERHNIPPVYVTSHMRGPAPDKARKEVMVVMISELHLARWQVAAMFDRDLRRVRKSELGV